jgi:hypothetical protein
MDGLMIFVGLAIAAQLALPLIGRWSARKNALCLAKARAHLVEDAADRQLQTHTQHTPKLDSKGAGDE